MRTSPLMLLACAMLISHVGSFWTQGQSAKTTLKAAIFVENRAGAALNDKITVLEDLLTARITRKGYSIISREVAVNALNSYDTLEVSTASSSVTQIKALSTDGSSSAAIGAGQASTAQVSSTPHLLKVDQLLNNSSSPLRLAQNLGADYLLVASITSLGREKKSFDDGNVKTINTVYTLRVGFKLLEGQQAGSLIADTIKVTKTLRETAVSHTDDGDLINDLLDQAADQIAQSAGSQRNNVPAEQSAAKLVEITVSCGMQDLVNLPISVPDIRLSENNTILVSTNRLEVQVLDATVEIDGVAIGSAPGKFKVRPGLSKLRISREGFKDWERTVNCSEGQKFNVALQMSETGYARWKDNTTFLFTIESGKKLTDGLRDMMGGVAQTFRQSGYRVDTKTDVKANIESKGKSLFDGATLKAFGK